jgi:hypothetical protein
VYQVSIQNDSPNLTDSFTIEASAGSPQHLRIRYFQGGTNITTDVENGTYVTTPSAPGNDRKIKIEIKIKNTAPANASVTRKLTIRSVGDPTKVDAVKVTAERS